MNYGWHDLIGITGVVLVLASYLLLQAGRLQADRLGYSVANAAGAFLILVSLWFDFNLSAFVIEAMWLLISLYGIARHSVRSRRAA